MLEVLTQTVTSTTFISPLPVPPTPVDPGTLLELPAFLEMLAGPSGWVALGMFISLVLRKLTWYNQQSKDIKTILPMALTILFSSLSYALVTFVPIEILNAITPFFIIMAGVIVTWMGNELTYLFFVKPTLSE